MRVASRVAAVGGVPVAVAAIIAVVAWFLLQQADRAREAAVLAGSAYRHLMAAAAVRNDYVHAAPTARERHAQRFQTLAEEARHDLERLEAIASASDQEAATAATRDSLDRYAARMERFKDITIQNDRLITSMGEQATTLIDLTDRARYRQHTANVELAASLAEADRKQRTSRGAVDRARDLRDALAAIWLHYAIHERLVPSVPRPRETPLREEGFLAKRLTDAAKALDETLSPGVPSSDRYAQAVATLQRALAAAPRDGGGGLDAATRHDALAVEARIDRLLKVNTTEYTAIQDEIAQLIGHSVQANQIELEMQNIAVSVLKLSRRTADALTHRDTQATRAIIVDSDALAQTVAVLSIPPLIQDEMVAAIDTWRSYLVKAEEGLGRQNDMIAAMDGDAEAMAEGARTLNDIFRAHASRIGDFLRTILVSGATAGLLLAGGAAFFVARSITRPVHRLQQQMMRLAGDPLAGGIDDIGRNDELGDMAEAVRFFVTEIGQREAAWRQAKDKADRALAELQHTQNELIQAEKLASLGHLVAGVAHEINTPVGIALTSSSYLGDETARIRRLAAAGRMRKADFESFLLSLDESTQLLTANLARAADLVQSFKQVAADQTHGERRRFDLTAYLDEVVRSLSPSWRKVGHQVTVTGPPNLEVDSLPGVFAQIVTNLVMNSLVHAYAEGQAGRMAMMVSQPDAGTVELVYEDDGRGIPAEHRARIFDPFFTTRRGAGSTGLGMHIVYNLVTVKLRGRIELAETGKPGVRFALRFPRWPAEPATPPATGGLPPVGDMPSDRHRKGSTT